jgi:phospholipid transport system transporter-binding protein
MTFQTVPEFLGHSAVWLKDAKGMITVDLAKVSLADSAGLALMLEWLEQAQAAKRELKFVNIPEQVKHLIDVSGLGQVFGSA